MDAGLEGAAGFLGDLDDGLSFIDGQSQRLLAVDVFAFAERVDGDEGVPVIGHGDGDGVNVFVIEQGAEVAVALRLEAVFLHHLQAVFEEALVHVASGDVDALLIFRVMVDGAAAALRTADADGTHENFVAAGGRSLAFDRGEHFARIPHRQTGAESQAGQRALHEAAPRQISPCA